MNNIVSKKLNFKGLKNAPGKDKFTAPKQSIAVNTSNGPIKKIVVRKIK